MKENKLVSIALSGRPQLPPDENSVPTCSGVNIGPNYYDKTKNNSEKVRLSEVFLKEFGDDEEKNYFEKYVNEFFPNYEIFWKNFIFIFRENPREINLIKEISKEVEKICMTHYTIFRNLTTCVRQIGKYIPQDSLKITFYSLGTIINLVERLSAHVSKLSGNNKNKIDPQKNNDFFKITKNYRNTYTHSYLPGYIKEGSVFYAIKPEKIKKYNLWSQIKYEKKNDDFVKEKDLIKEYTERMVKSLNQIWEESFIPAMGKIDLINERRKECKWLKDTDE